MKKYVETERLYFRRFNLNDAKELAKQLNHRDMLENLLHLPYPYTIDHARWWILQHDELFDHDRIYEFAIILKETNKLIGSIGLSYIEKNKHGETGYWIAKDYWGKGYATEALKGLIKWAFEEKDFHKVIASHFARNKASGKVMQKAGMTYEGCQKEHILKDGVFHDSILYGIIKEIEE